MMRRVGGTSIRFAYGLVAALIYVAGPAGCTGVGAIDQPTPWQTNASIARPVSDGQCPNLAGKYREIGDGRNNDGKAYVAHLMGNVFADSYYGKRDASDREALFVRAFHPIPGTLRMAAVVNDKVVGTREFGSREKWYCSQQRLVFFSATPFNIEAGSGTRVELHAYYVSGEQKLCRTTEWKMVFVFGGPKGYSSTACYSRVGNSE